MSEEQIVETEEKVRSVTIQLNSLFETISKTKYRLLAGREELKVAEMELKLMENKMKFMRETEIPIVQQKVKYMQGHLLGLEKKLKELVDTEVAI